MLVVVALRRGLTGELLVSGSSEAGHSLEDRRVT